MSRLTVLLLLLLASPLRAEPVLTRAPVLATFVEAPFPPSESVRHARVVLLLTLDETGRVTASEVVESAGEAFDAAAVEASLQFVFEPAEVDGVPSAIQLHYAYEFSLKEETPTEGVLAGRVIERGTARPLAGLTVEVGALTTTTDEDGAFVFESLEPGTVPVMLSGEGLVPLRTAETIAAGARVDVVYELSLPAVEADDEDSDDLEIVVMAPPAAIRVASASVSATDARLVPGAQGDVLKVVESMPGVGRGGAGSGALVVWGAAPGDTRTYIDGVPVPRLYHEGGWRSVLHSRQVKSVDLLPGAYGAGWGRGIGGVVSVETKPLSPGPIAASVSADLFEGAAFVAASPTETTTVSASGRYGWLDRTSSPFVPERTAKFAPIPRFHDLQLRAAWQLAPAESLEVSLLHSGDALSRGVPDEDPAFTVLESREEDFQRLWARWRRDTASGVHVEVVPWLGRGATSLSTRVGDVSTGAQSTTLAGGLRVLGRARLHSMVTAEGGLDAEVVSSSLVRRGSMGLPAREGDVRVFGQPPPDSINADDWRTVTVGAAPWVGLDLTLHESLKLLPGLRVDPNVRSVNRKAPREGETPPIGLFLQSFSVEPRLAVQWTASDLWSVKAAVGRHAQPPAPDDLSAVFGTPLLPIASALHSLVGARFAPTPALSFEATGFHTRADSLAVRNALDAPRLAEALVATGESRTSGVQLLARLQQDALFGWVSYVLSRSERRTDASSAWRLSDFDQTHVLTAVAGWRPGAHTELGVRARFASGYPRTDVVGAWYDAKRDRMQPLFGAHNEARIPAFFQLDLRAARRFELPVGTLEVSAELQNITHRANAEEIVWSPDFSRRDFITGLPFVALLGASWNL